jgi:uncharacterized protein (TIGR02466 family)
MKLFPTPVYMAEVTNFEKIQMDFDEVRKHLKFEKPTGWHSHSLSDPTFSSNFILDYKLSAFEDELEQHILQYLKQINSPLGTTKPLKYRIYRSWMTLTSNGEYAHTHCHGDSDISGVYYLDSNSLDGNLFFQSPNKIMSTSTCFTHIPDATEIIPKTGLLLLFPGWLDHGVRTNITEHERISVSFNIIIDRYYE